MGLSRKKQIKLYSKYWQEIEQLAKDNKTNTTKVSDFIIDFLTIENKKIPNKNKVYEKFKLDYPKPMFKELEELLNKIKCYARFYSKLINPGKETDTNINQQIKYIKKLEINVSYPSEVISMLKEEDVYNIQTKNRTYFLERLENFKNTETVVIEDNEKITIEHIFPQNPDPAWKQEFGSKEYKEIKENLLNTIGNITLSGYNISLSNKKFLTKKDFIIDGVEIGYKFSRLWLNAFLKDIDVWNKENIEKRFDIISKRFLEIWQYPQVEQQTENIEIEVNIFEAEDPTEKKLSYALFFDQKLNVSDITGLYKEVMQKLFELEPDTFLKTELKERLEISKVKEYFSLNNSYHIETNLSNRRKFNIIKYTLDTIECTEELFIKYENN